MRQSSDGGGGGWCGAGGGGGGARAGQGREGGGDGACCAFVSFTRSVILQFDVASQVDEGEGKSLLAAMILDSPFCDFEVLAQELIDQVDHDDSALRLPLTK